MKLSEQLRQDHESGDFGKALEGYSERAEALERRIAELESDKSCALYVDYEKSCQALKKHIAEMSK